MKLSDIEYACLCSSYTKNNKIKNVEVHKCETYQYISFIVEFEQSVEKIEYVVSGDEIFNKVELISDFLHYQCCEDAKRNVKQWVSNYVFEFCCLVFEGEQPNYQVIEDDINGIENLFDSLVCQSIFKGPLFYAVKK